MDSTLTDMLIDHFEAHGELAKQLHEASRHIYAIMLCYSISQITNSYV